MSNRGTSIGLLGTKTRRVMGSEKTRIRDKARPDLAVYLCSGAACYFLAVLPARTHKVCALLRPMVMAAGRSRARQPRQWTASVH